LVKLLCSNELSALLTHIAQQQNEDAEEIKIGNILVKDILTALGTTKADLIAALDNVEEEQISTTITIQDTDYTLDFSDMQLVFTLNDDKTVSSLDITTTIKFLGAPVNISATIVYSDEELTLSDISACNVSVPHAIYNDGTRTETLDLTLGDDSDGDSAVAVKVNPVFADNALSAFVVTIDGNTIESTYDPDTATLTFTYNETEYVYTVVQQTFSQSIFDSEENGEILLIAVYPQGETADSGNVVRIQADQMETLTYTVEEFLAA
jgi:hypothetical protein